MTKDVFQRIKGDIIGVPAQDFRNEQVSVSDAGYTGRTLLYATARKIDEFYKKGSLDLKYIKDIDEDTGDERPYELQRNEFVMLMSLESSKHTALGRFDGEKLVTLQYIEERPFGVTARNVGQKFVQEALMMSCDEVPLVIVKGAAGTAKTFLSLAVGLHKIMNVKQRQYRKILVCRPNVKFDEDIGFLPGSETEKLAPFMRSVIDNLEILLDSSECDRYQNENELSDKVSELFPPQHHHNRGHRLYPGPLHPEKLGHHRRGAKPDAQTDQGHRHARGQGYENHPHRRPGPDRPPVSRQPYKRAVLCLRAHEGQPLLLPDHHARRRVRKKPAGV